MNLRAYKKKNKKKTLEGYQDPVLMIEWRTTTATPVLRVEDYKSHATTAGT